LAIFHNAVFIIGHAVVRLAKKGGRGIVAILHGGFPEGVKHAEDNKAYKK